MLRKSGVEAEVIQRVGEARGRNAIDLIRDGRIQLIINTPTAGQAPREDQIAIRARGGAVPRAGHHHDGGRDGRGAGAGGSRAGRLGVKSLQEYHQEMDDQQELSSLSSGIA